MVDIQKSSIINPNISSSLLTEAPGIALIISSNLFNALQKSASALIGFKSISANFKQY